jgi:hypothetical protein
MKKFSIELCQAVLAAFLIGGPFFYYMLFVMKP